MLDVIALELVLLHTLDGRSIYVNPAAIIKIEETRAKGSVLVDEVNCVIFLSDRWYISVKESCAEVRTLFDRRPK